MSKIMKNRRFFFLFFLLGMLLAGKVNAQDVVGRSSEKTIISGREYYMHRIKTGQTLTDLSEIYNVSVEEIERLNPEVKDGLREGHVIGIPVRPAKKPTKKETQTAKVEPKPVAAEPKETRPAGVESKPVEVKPAPVVEQPKKRKDTVVVEQRNARLPYYDGKAYIVQQGENLYDIAKKQGIELS